MKVALTVDMEQDCPPYLDTHRGVEAGTPLLLKLFEQEKVHATFFTTGAVARRYPQVVQAIVAAGHELGCHGDTHRKFNEMGPEEAQKEIRESTQTLRQHYPVLSFRAPNLVFPEAYLKFLEAENYELDSSEAKYKSAYRKRHKASTRLKRIPASVTSSVLRLPKAIRFPWFSRLQDPAVLFVHPWEFVDFRKSKLRLDCRFRTGQTALDCLRENIHFFRNRGANFLKMQDL